MEQYINKADIEAEIDKLDNQDFCVIDDLNGRTAYLLAIGDFYKALDTLEAKDPYEECIQYPTVRDGIEAHAETYSFNIESELFNQLTKEQQALWRKEIEQACISGGEAGVELARDPRYKENLEVKEVDYGIEVHRYAQEHFNVYDDVNQTLQTKENKTLLGRKDFEDIAKHFFELGLKQNKL